MIKPSCPLLSLAHFFCVCACKYHMQIVKRKSMWMHEPKTGLQNALLLFKGENHDNTGKRESDFHQKREKKKACVFSLAVT